VAEAPVVNASPLIFLSRSNLLHLLRLAGETVIVPAVVAEEINRRGPDDPTARALHDNAWLQVRATPAVPDSVRVWDLGDGESGVLSWALAHPGSEAILDDLAARRCAATLQIPVRGTLGLVLLAKQRGVIPSARTVLNQLRDSGMYLSDRVLNQALALVE
jgi:predicted nucleic acid-binding protein